MEELNRLSIDEFKKSKRLSISVLLDNVRSGYNVGSIFRTCDAFGVDELILCGITPAPPNREVMKTSLGSSGSVNWKYSSNTQETIHELKNLGAQIIVVEQTDESIPLDHFQFEANKKYLLIFGNEVEGVGDAALSLANHAIEIPQFGTKHSHNVSVAAGIVLWQFYRCI